MMPAKTDPTQRLSGLSASIVGTLKARIVGWEYPPEHRLTEEALCREFGVSRSPVREALRALVTNGFIRKMQNRGYAVRQLDLRELEELYDLRTAIELHVVERLARHATGRSELDALRETWKGIRAGPARKGEELAQLDTRFHEALAELTGNRVLLEQLHAINERLLVFRMIDFDEPQRAESTCRQHIKVIERIIAGDPDGARAAMRRNIDDGREIVHYSIKEALARAYASATGFSLRPGRRARRAPARVPA